MWIDPVTVVESGPDHLTLSSPNTFTSRRLEASYLPMFRQEFFRIGQGDIRIQFIVKEARTDRSAVPERRAAVPDPMLRPVQKALPGLGMRFDSGRYFKKGFTFGQFVKGENSDFAYCAARALARDTGGGKYKKDISSTEEAYLWLQRNAGYANACRIWGIKGYSYAMPTKLKMGSILNKTPTGKPLKLGMRLVLLDTDKLKDMFYERMAKPLPVSTAGCGCIRKPLWRMPGRSRQSKNRSMIKAWKPGAFFCSRSWTGSSRILWEREMASLGANSASAWASQTSATAL